MKCGMKVDNRQCKKEVKSGATLDVVGDRVVFCCTVHYNAHSLSADPVPSKYVFVSTKKVQEDNMNEYSDADFDREYSYDVALAQLEGQPFNDSALRGGGHALVEQCGHEKCHIHFSELWWESNDNCCGVPNCAHYTAWLCLNHVPAINNKENINMNNDDIIKEAHVPTSTVTGSTDKAYGWVKCVKCSKEIGENWYHPSSDDVRVCMGVEPRPAFFNADTLTKTWEKRNGTQMMESWFATMEEAKAYAIEEKGVVKPAKNRHGFWVSVEV